jgi:hypothetical protein
MAAPPADEPHAQAVPGGAGEQGGPAPAQQATGDARVDDALSRLAGVAGLPVAGHPAVFEEVHRLLAGALAGTSPPDREPGRAGGHGGAGGAGGPGGDGAGGDRGAGGDPEPGHGPAS